MGGRKVIIVQLTRQLGLLIVNNNYFILVTLFALYFIFSLRKIIFPYLILFYQYMNIFIILKIKLNLI